FRWTTNLVKSCKALDRRGFGRDQGGAEVERRQLPLTDLVRQSVYSRLAGYEDVNDAERLAQDPAFRLIGSRKIWERGGALTSRLQSFETEVLTQAKNLAGLAALNRELSAGRRPSTHAGGWCWTWTAPRFLQRALRV